MLRAAIVVLLVTASSAFAEGPSFDCGTARSPREIVVCGDVAAARTDREMAVAYREARRGLPSDLSRRLAADQRAFIDELDDGFNATVWFKGGLPEDERQVRSDLSRVLLDRGGALVALRSEISWRTKFLSRIDPNRPTFVGEWAMHGSRLNLSPTKADGTVAVSFEHPSYGWPKYRCRFEATAHAVDGTLIVESVHDGDLDETRQTRLILRREDGALVTTETLTGESGPGACIRAGLVEGTFFATER